MTYVKIEDSKIVSIKRNQKTKIRGWRKVVERKPSYDWDVEYLQSNGFSIENGVVYEDFGIKEVEYLPLEIQFMQEQISKRREEGATEEEIEKFKEEFYKEYGAIE